MPRKVRKDKGVKKQKQNTTEENWVDQLPENISNIAIFIYLSGKRVWTIDYSNPEEQSDEHVSAWNATTLNLPNMKSRGTQAMLVRADILSLARKRGKYDSFVAYVTDMYDTTDRWFFDPDVLCEVHFVGDREWVEEQVRKAQSEKSSVVHEMVTEDNKTEIYERSDARYKNAKKPFKPLTKFHIHDDLEETQRRLTEAFARLHTINLPPGTGLR